jgi:signal transduction histidine kinase
MALQDASIQKKLIRVILLITCAVLLLTCTSYFAYEFITFRQTTVRQLSTLGKILAENSTAALAFQNPTEGNEILSALKAEPHIVAACLYDADGNLFSTFPADVLKESFPPTVNKSMGYFFEASHLIGFEPVVEGKLALGTLFLKSDMGAMYERFMLYAILALLIIVLSLLLAYLLSKRMQKQITIPILRLALTAEAISNRQDYSVRAEKSGNDEIGLLTDAFNHMLGTLEKQTDEIMSFNQKLEQNIKDRTHELQSANKELEAFSYSVSHDLRAPLRSIHGYMNIFSEDYFHQLDDEGKRLISVSIANARKMGQLIDDLLEFSQLGRKAMRKVEVDMKELVTDVWKEQTEMAPGREIELRMQTIHMAHAERVTIRQVWTNLISNAIKYSMNSKSAVIQIGSYLDGLNVVFYVRDNGAGFDMKYYEKLFGVFQRLHSEDEFDGTGVGLAIVARIISKHEGKVWAEAAVGEGATFYFSLPVLENQ